MINVIDIIGKHLEEQGIGVYDGYALGGNIFAGKMCCVIPPVYFAL